MQNILLQDGDGDGDNDISDGLSIFFGIGATMCTIQEVHWTPTREI